MSYNFFVLPKNYTQMRKEIYWRMQEEGLLGSSMSSIATPTLKNWLRLTSAHRGWLLCCVQAEATTHNVENLCAVAWLEPWKDAVWTFDFTAFRKHFKFAETMSKEALRWMFEHAPCTSIMGLCSASNAHAWKIAENSGFKMLGKVPKACFHARRNCYEDGILVLASVLDFKLSKNFI